MIVKYAIKAGEVKSARHDFVKIEENSLFPLLTIDVGSYIMGSQIQSGINYAINEGVHNLQIGRYTSIADEIVFMINMNHDYTKVSQGYISVIGYDAGISDGAMKRKGQIIIENDCWIGHSATIFSGVTIHDGAVVAANSVVTKDVPPYAMVAGNPARIIKYRFSEEQVKDLQKIAWWDWSTEKIIEYKESFDKPIQDFINEHIDLAKRKISNIKPCEIERIMLQGGDFYLFFLDMDEPYPIYKKVIRQFVEKFNAYDAELLIYICYQNSKMQEYIDNLLTYLSGFEEYDVYINICSDVIDEASLIRSFDYYITNRSKENISRMCKAELFGVTCLSGVDSAVF